LGRKKSLSLILWFGVFAVTLIPVFHFSAISQTAYFAERYLYIPSFAAIIALTTLAGHRASRRYLSVFAVAIALFGGMTFARNRDWADNEAFYSSALRVYPEAMMMRVALAESISSRGDHELAKSHFETALQFERTTALLQAPFQGHRAYVGLGAIAVQQQKYDEAKKYGLEALRLYPNGGGAHTILGIVALAENDLQTAVAYLEKAVALNALGYTARSYLATAFLRANRFSEAARHSRDALNINPTHADARSNLYQALLGLAGAAAAVQRYDEAKEHLRQALALNPNDAGVYVYLGGVAMQADEDYPAALSHLEKAIALDPQNAVAHDYLGSTLFNMGRYKEAVQYFERAIQINAGFQEARMHLEMARLRVAQEN
jgi:tetratricopeptide (TPR) repeat protein